ncbi:hypothetical protein ACI79D_23365 [Geodermatophilus sp. SYSU D00708]
MEPHPHDEVLLRRAAVATGWSDDELARHTRGGRLARLRRGAYLPGAVPVDPVARHRLLVRATLAGLRRPAVVSHQSAAVLHGLPLWGVGLGRVHVTRRPPASSEAGRLLRSHVARLQDDEVVTVDGLAVTSPVRTALDLARTLPLEPAVVALDAVLAAEVVEHEQLRGALAGVAGTRGSRAAARAVDLADGRSESVGESHSRVLLHRLGSSPSTLQREIHSADGVFLGRADFAWEAEGVLGEFDGRVKYGRALRPGQDPGDAEFEEKRREDALRDEDWRVVRWTWADLTPGDVVANRVGRALARGRRRVG